MKEIDPSQPLRRYAGIGSRETPEAFRSYMSRVAERLARRGYILRSGAAQGADAAFEAGCLDGGGKAEIWLPWEGFNDHADTGLYPSDRHLEMAKELHPNWERLNRGPRLLHARNVGQVLGEDLSTPVDFVLCWTPDGCESAQEWRTSTGGTGLAIALASQRDIPVFNLARPGARDRLARHILQGERLEHHEAVQ